MKPEEEIPKILQLHLRDIDNHLLKMIDAHCDHKSIHDYRETVRRLRALLFYFKPLIHIGDYQQISFISKRHFDETSLIREIDVFENGYQDKMAPETLQKIQMIKAPLLSQLVHMTEAMRTFHFGEVEVRTKNPISDEKYEDWIVQRQIELFRMFIQNDEVNPENIESYIHKKRMLAKKLQYVHIIIMTGNYSLVTINQSIESFKQISKKLHDTCVNLRYIGQYELNDPQLLHQLILDHSKYLKEANASYEACCQLMKTYIQTKNID